MGEHILTLERFIAEHEKRERHLKDYLLTGWGRKHVEESTVRTLEERNAKSLYATNTFARIAFAQAAEEVFSDLEFDEGEKAFFVTLTPKRFARPLNQASVFNHDECKAWSGKILRRSDYVAIVEPAFYGNARLIPGASQKTVCWHSHAIVWGIPEANLADRLLHVNKKEEPFLPGGLTAHFRVLTPGRIKGRLLYMLKAPLKEYRVSPTKEERIDHETGEIILTGAFRQWKGNLNPGDAMRLCKVLGDRTLPMLCFAGGEGVSLLTEIEATARSRLSRRHVRRQRRLREVSEFHQLR